MKELKLSECKWPEVYISIPKEIAKESLQYQNKMTAVEFIVEQVLAYKSPTNVNGTDYILIPVDKIDFLKEQAIEMEKQEKIKILRSLVYSVCIGDDVEDIEEWLKEHELNKSE